MVEPNNPTVSDNTESGALNMVKLTIDNCEVMVPEHTTILDAAKSAGIQIPTLCYLRDLNEIGGCRVCVVEVEGCDQLVAACNNYVLENGRDLSRYDVENRSHVCVLGAYVAQSLFQYADPIGQTVYLGGVPFEVVGTYYQKDGGTEESMDDMVSIPYSMARSLMSTDHLTGFTVKVDKSDNVDTVIRRLETVLDETIDSSVGTYRLEDGNSAMSESTEETTSMSVVLGGIAGIALLVGGIGIMNLSLIHI